MLKHMTLWMLVVLGGPLILSNVAHGYEEMSFGVDEVARSSSAGASLDMLNEGKKLYERRQYAPASLMFYNIMQDSSFDAQEYAPAAEYELAKTLFRMELYQGALAYFGRIVESGDRHPYYIPTLRGLILLTDVIADDPMLVEYLASYANRFPTDIPEAYRDTYAYFVGRHFYNIGLLDEALRILGHVSPRSDLYPRARYIIGVTHVANYDARTAVDAYRDVLRHLQQKDSTGRLSKDDEKILELTNLAMARVFYSIGQFDTSLRYFSRIERFSPVWLQSLFESSWAYFQVDRYNLALGNLHTLGAPFFTDMYFPEGPILSAVILFYNCQYRRVRDVLDEFGYLYEPLKDEISSIVERHGDPMAMFDWVQRFRNGDVALAPQIYQVFQGALYDDQVTRRINLVQAIEQERQKMRRLPDNWQGHALGSALNQENALAHSFAVTDAGELADARLRRIVTELEELIIQQKRILFEVARAERGDIQADMRAGMVVESLTQDDGHIKVPDEFLYWRFIGEYWKDELGYYVFDSHSQCKR